MVPVSASTVSAAIIGKFLCHDIRDFKIWYGEAVVGQQIVKITSGEVMTCVPLQLSLNLNLNFIIIFFKFIFI